MTETTPPEQQKGEKAFNLLATHAKDAIAGLVLTKEGNIIATHGEQVFVSWSARDAEKVFAAVAPFLEKGRDKAKQDELVSYDDFVYFVRKRLDSMAEDMQLINEKLESK
jgi:hypothetical protein